MAFNDIFRLRIYQRLHGAQVINVLHFVQDDPLPTRGALELATDFVTNMRATMIVRASSAMLFEYVEVQSMIPFAGGPVTVNFPGGTVGSNASACASATLAEVVTVYTERAGRRGRGRMYLAGAPTSTSDIQLGAWMAVQTARTQGYITALNTRYVAASHPIGWMLGVWSKVLAGPDPPFPTSCFARASSLTVRTLVRNQRRRQVGVGR